ncbi:MAG: hypothetical protein BM562_05570 [Alphaproteobacteria bacterium MedPE-SWcel]|nr:MAG: hypothetical protein BM562_05570 [Alphaproteobacteria bacterium MedPE-SWcel]
MSAGRNLSVQEAPMPRFEREFTSCADAICAPPTQVDPCVDLCADLCVDLWAVGAPPATTRAPGRARGMRVRPDRAAEAGVVKEGQAADGEEVVGGLRPSITFVSNAI